MLTRVSTLPLPPHAKATFAASVAGSKVYYGCAVAPLGPTRSTQLQRSFTAAVWSGQGKRATEVVLNTLHKGHRLDPEVAVPYACVTQWVTLVNKSHTVAALTTEAWEHRNALDGTFAGPFHQLCAAFRTADWVWEQPLKLRYTDADGIVTQADVSCW